METSVASLRNRIDELESLLKEKESGVPSHIPASRTERDQEEIPVLDEIISSENAGQTKNDDAFNVLIRNAPDEDRISEIIKKLDEQISNDLEALIKLLKRSIMESIKKHLLKELTNKPDKQYSFKIDNGNSKPKE